MDVRRRADPACQDGMPIGAVLVHLLEAPDTRLEVGLCLLVALGVSLALWRPGARAGGVVLSGLPVGEGGFIRRRESEIACP
ncbi:MAG: hypothetical protein ACLQCU_01075 [Acidimicrobiales bacterium]